MKKKKYQTPQMKSVEVKAQQIICASPYGVKTEVLVEDNSFSWE